MKPIVILPLCAVLLAAAAPAGADEILLKNGRTLEGKVVEGADSVTWEKAGLRMEIRRDEVQEIRRTPTVKEEYAKRVAALPAAPSDAKAVDLRPEAHHRLGLWCEQKGLKDEARDEQEKALRLDPEHAGARRALGYLKVDGMWRLEEDVMKERGLVRTASGWMTPGEAESLAAAAPSAKQQARIEKKALDTSMRKSLNRALRLVADPDAALRVKGEAALITWAREAGDPEFEARVPEVRAYYDRLHEEVNRARALVEVRAQLVTLKRPIPKFTTSLGAATSPVTLQLPELSVVSISTMAILPLEVDED